jgi:aldose 1-epimerase
MLSPEALAYGTLLIAGFLMLRRSRRAGLALRRQHGVIDGQPVQLHTLTNSRGMEVSFSEFGATLTSIRVPDVHGRLGEVTLGLRSLEDYVAGNPFLGSTVGRYANRLAGGKLTIDGCEIALAQNNNGNHLHGGLRALDKRIWKSEANRTADASSVRFTYVSPDGEEGYPGTLSVTVTYTLQDAADELTIDFAATTDAPTACNLTNHVFLNLAGQGNVLDHRLTLRSDRLVPVTAALIPTGELMDVTNTPFDFRRPHAIGERIGAPHDQLRRGRGYDHCYDLGTDKSLKSAAFVTEASSGRTLEVLTDAPGLQLYTGNFLTGTVQGRWPKPFAFRQGFCLEPGLFPDSPNQPAFHRLGYPSGILRPGEQYSQKLIFRFGVIRG